VALNAYVSQNQHRWKESLGGNMCGVLEDAAARLKWAWNLDMKHQESYPFNTSYAFGEIVQWMRECAQRDSKGERKNPKLRDLLRGMRPPRRFSDLVDDRIIKSLYEDQNAGSYEKALKCAASADRSAHFVFHRILKLVDAAYVIGHFGDGAQPKPRVHFLHRNLLQIADLAGLADLKHEGVVEFLDDLCPCGKAHRVDAIRKLRKRFMRRRSSTSQQQPPPAPKNQ
jgi:hypothetical protein